MQRNYRTLSSSDDESDELARIQAKLTKKTAYTTPEHCSEGASLLSSDESSLSTIESLHDEPANVAVELPKRMKASSSRSNNKSPESNLSSNSSLHSSKHYNTDQPLPESKIVLKNDQDTMLLQALQATMDALKGTKPAIDMGIKPAPRQSATESDSIVSNRPRHVLNNTSEQHPVEQEQNQDDMCDGSSLTDEELLAMDLDVFAPSETTIPIVRQNPAPSEPTLTVRQSPQEAQGHVAEMGDDSNIDSNLALNKEQQELEKTESNNSIASMPDTSLQASSDISQVWPIENRVVDVDFDQDAHPTDEMTDADMARAFGFDDAHDLNAATQGAPFDDNDLQWNVTEITDGDANRRVSEVDPALYAPEIRDHGQATFVHRFNQQNRPSTQRKRTPVVDVFQPPVSALWQGKFETFNQLQSEMANVLAFSDDNIVVSAPTGAGKTAVFEMAMARFFTVDLQVNQHQQRAPQISLQRKIVYISPSKALCEERLNDWSTRLLAMRLGINVALVTGDGDPSDAFRDLNTAHVVLTTPEKWDSLTRRWTENFVLFASFKLMLVDEIHLLADESRGWCLESILCRTKTIQRAATTIQLDQDTIVSSSYPHTSQEAINSVMRYIAVSATLPNIDEIAEFLNACEAYTFDESYRPVPLQLHVIGQGFVGDDSTSQYRFWSGLNKHVPELIFRFSENRPSIVFCHSKPDAESLADLLATVSGIATKGNGNQDIASQTRVVKLQRVLYAGVAFHHAGLDIDDRALVQKAFTEGRIRVLCATSTLAMGVNYPARLVIIKGTKAWRGGEQGYQDLDKASLLQMIGRAGRPGFDTSGTAVIMTDNKSKARYQKVALDGLDIAKSCFLAKKYEIINTAISQWEIGSTVEAVNWLKQTLYYIRLLRDPSHHPLSLDEHLVGIGHDAFAKLVSVGAIQQSEDDHIQPTPAGTIMSQSLVELQAMEIMAQIPHDATQSMVLQAISHIEGLQRPVRRQEKKFLNQAHGLVKYKLAGPKSKVRVKEPWEKAFVLLQASIGQIHIEDYSLRQEMTGMVEYASRMLSALEDYSIKSTRNGQVALRSLMLRRSFATNVWNQHDGVLNQIINVGPKSTAALKFHGITSFKDVLAASDKQIERAAQRASPFAATLRTAVSKIQQGACKLSASFEYAHNTRTPCKLICHITPQDSQKSRQNVQGSSPVSYTLLAFTDRQGGCLLFRRDLSTDNTIAVPVPPLFEKITVLLVASIVGLDEKIELQGNDNTTRKRPVAIDSEQANLPKQRKIRDLSKSMHQTCDGRRKKADATRRKQSNLQSKINLKSITPSPKNTMNAVGEGSELRPERSQTQEILQSRSQKPGYRDQTQHTTEHADTAIPSIDQEYLLQPRKNMPRDTQTSKLLQKADVSQAFHASSHSSAFDPLQPCAINATLDHDAIRRSCQDHPQQACIDMQRITSPMFLPQVARATHAFETSWNAYASETLQPESLNDPPHQTVWDERHQQRDKIGGASVISSALVNGRHYAAADFGAAASPASAAAWVKQKREHVSSQGRAFTRKKDNPFSSYMHDPNFGENRLDQLSARKDSINVLDKHPALARNYQANPVSVPFGHKNSGQRIGARRRGYNGPSERDLLAQKSSEMYAYSHSPAAWESQHSQMQSIAASTLSSSRSPLTRSNGYVKSTNVGGIPFDYSMQRSPPPPPHTDVATDFQGTIWQGYQQEYQPWTARTAYSVQPRANDLVLGIHDERRTAINQATDVGYQLPPALDAQEEAAFFGTSL